MHKSKSGFTIVELLIVIVIIAILAAVTVVAYSSIQSRGRNAAIIKEGSDWSKLIKLYIATYGQMPSVPSNYYCLGTGFPVGTGGTANCRDYNGTNYVVESNNAALMTELQKVGSISKGERIPIGGYIGPFIYSDFSVVPKVIDVIIVLRGSSASDCPKNQTVWYTDNATVVFCYERITSLQ